MPQQIYYNNNNKKFASKEVYTILVIAGRIACPVVGSVGTGPVGRSIAARSVYDMFSEYHYLIVNLVFLTWVFGVGISF